MKLLFDQNLSPRLVDRLRDLCECAHVHPLGLGEADDREIWRYARRHGFVIVTKDADFVDLAALAGAPPRVIWLTVGNCSVTQIEVLVRERFAALTTWLEETDAAVFALG